MEDNLADEDKTSRALASRRLSSEMRNRRERIQRHFDSLETRIAKVSAYQEASLELAINLFKQRIELLDAMSSNWRDPETGEFSPRKLTMGMHERNIAHYFRELEKIEKQAGLVPTKKEEKTVTITLADKFRELQGEVEGEFLDAIDAEIVE